MRTEDSTSAKAVPPSLDGKTYQQGWQLGLAKRAIMTMIDLPEGLAVRESKLVEDLLFTPDELVKLSAILKTDYRVVISDDELKNMTLGQLADKMPQRVPLRIEL